MRDSNAYWKIGTVNVPLLFHSFFLFLFVWFLFSSIILSLFLLLLKENRSGIHVSECEATRLSLARTQPVHAISPTTDLLILLTRHAHPHLKSERDKHDCTHTKKCAIICYLISSNAMMRRHCLSFLLFIYVYNAFEFIKKLKLFCWFNKHYKIIFLLFFHKII